MRKTPYNFTAPNAGAESSSQNVTEKVTEQSFDDSLVTDLADVIKRPQAPKPSAEIITETVTETHEPVAAETTEPGSANLSEGVEKMKTQLSKQVEQINADPMRSAKNVLKFINLGRMLLYPWLYKKIIFEGQEGQDLDAVLSKVAELQKKNQDPEKGDALNAYEMRIWKKYQGYEGHKKGIMWSSEEVDQIADVAYLKLAEVKFLNWLINNEWALVIIYIESKRILPVVGQRMGMSDFSLLTDL